MYKLKKAPADSEFKKIQPAPAWKKILFIIAPRPRDLIAKSYNFWLGFIPAYVTLGVHPNRIPIIEFLFGNSTANVPAWKIWAYGSLVFILHELVLQQAKLLWDDIRDGERDKTLFQNKRRAVASGLLSKRAAIINMWIRWVLAFILGYALGGTSLTLAFLAIALHQVLYVMWGKPTGRAHPVLVLSILAFNFPLRMLAGAITASGDAWRSMLIIILFLSLYFQVFGAMSAQWRLEAEHTRNPDGVSSIRPQSNYYLKFGEGLQRYGLLVASIISAIPLVLIHITILSIHAPWFDWFEKHIFQLPSLDHQYQPMEAFIALLVPICILTLASPRDLQPSKAGRITKPLIDFIRRIRTVSTPLLLFVAFGMVAASAINGRLNCFFAGILCLNLAIAVSLEGITYEEWSLENIRKRLPIIARGWYAFFFRPVPGLDFRKLLMITFTDIDIDKHDEML